MPEKFYSQSFTPEVDKIGGWYVHKHFNKGWGCCNPNYINEGKFSNEKKR